MIWKSETLRSADDRHIPPFLLFSQDLFKIATFIFSFVHSVKFTTNTGSLEHQKITAKYVSKNQWQVLKRNLEILCDASHEMWPMTLSFVADMYRVFGGSSRATSPCRPSYKVAILNLHDYNLEPSLIIWPSK